MDFLRVKLSEKVRSCSSNINQENRIGLLANLATVVARRTPVHLLRLESEEDRHKSVAFGL